MLIRFFKEVYESFDLGDIRVELSTKPRSIGSRVWESAEKALREALEQAEMEFQINEAMVPLWAKNRLSHL